MARKKVHIAHLFILLMIPSRGYRRKETIHTVRQLPHASSRKVQGQDERDSVVEAV
jgi:hypothetical protein